MKRILFSLIVAASALCAMAWGQKGHDVTAFIAERHLTPAAKAAVDSILEGKSMVYWANWLDNASHTPEFAYTKTWHYKNVDEGLRYEEAPVNPAGDAVLAIKRMIEILKDPAEPFEKKNLAMKILVHVTGDLHMPLHMGHATDLGGNRIKVKYFGRDNNIHAVWDSSLPESAHKWTYTEWADQIDRVSPAEIEFITSGSIDDWAKETIGLASEVYRYFPAGKEISYNDVAYWSPVIERQFLFGGLRLAHILNEIYK